MDSKSVAWGWFVLWVFLPPVVFVYSLIFGFEWFFKEAVEVMKEMEKEAAKKKQKPKTQIFFYESEQIPYWAR